MACIPALRHNSAQHSQVGEEGVYVASLEHGRVFEERHNFDPVGHYSRPDVTQLQVNRERQSTVKFKD